MGKLFLWCSFVLVALLFATINSGCNGDIDSDGFGIFELKRGDFSAKFTNYGATMLSLLLPDKNGNLDDVVLGYQTVKEYTNDRTYFGAIVGRVANRIGGAEFTLNGTVYKLVANEGKNMLHGGPKGFSDVVWTVGSYKEDSHVTFIYNSFDGEQGNLSVKVTYMLIGEDKLGVKMEATSVNKATPVNLALHTYWNLRGHNKGDILSHEVQLFASQITPVDSELIPTGEIVGVKGTAYDFLESHQIGSMIHQLPNGFDINYVLDKTSSHHFTKVAIVEESSSGRKMELWTNQAGVQYYTGNLLTEVKGKEGVTYLKHAGLCLETQGFPDSVNHQNFPSQIVNPGDSYMHVMVFRFTAE